MYDTLVAGEGEIDRVHRELTSDDIARIAATYHVAWGAGK